MRARGASPRFLVLRYSVLWRVLERTAEPRDVWRWRTVQEMHICRCGASMGKLCLSADRRRYEERYWSSDHRTVTLSLGYIQTMARINQSVYSVPARDTPGKNVGKLPSSGQPIACERNGELEETMPKPCWMACTCTYNAWTGSHLCRAEFSVVVIMWMVWSAAFTTISVTRSFHFGILECQNRQESPLSIT